jgi:hypothetical protein
MYSTNKKHVYTNDCHFVDSTGDGNFEIRQDGENRLYLVQNEKLSDVGLVIIVK